MCLCFCLCVCALLSLSVSLSETNLPSESYGGLHLFVVVGPLLLLAQSEVVYVDSRIEAQCDTKVDLCSSCFFLGSQIMITVSIQKTRIVHIYTLHHLIHTLQAASGQ